ncbi:MAG: threonine synthase [Bacteroidales bacterium]|nr:threonine synthase [Bacteroidales bacterium]
MLYYSTNGQAPKATLGEAVVAGLAPDRGLYMPESIPTLPAAFFNNIDQMSLVDIAYVVSNTLFGKEIDSATLKDIVSKTLSFDIPLKKVDDRSYSLELFHGPTLAFKDVGARFMALLLGHFNRQDKTDKREVNVLVATSGDTGSAVANGFLGVDGVHVYVLYPKGKVSNIQESQFTTLGHNITAIAVRGTFDDCQALVKNAFMDQELREKLKLTSANSINIARFLPQSFYYFHAYARMKEKGIKDVVISVPSGNLGNLTAGLIAKRMGLPVKRFIAANNRNDVFFKYLQTGVYTPTHSIPTLANAMDVGDPSNFARILDLYSHNHDAITADITGYTYTDAQIEETMRRTIDTTGYLLDPHGATAYQALQDGLKPGETGVFLETAHPAKFKEKVEPIVYQIVNIPPRLQAFMDGKKEMTTLRPYFPSFKKFLLETAR